MSSMRPADDLIRKRDNVWAKRGMAPQYAPPPEVVEKRTEFGKTWDLGGGTYHMSTSIGPVHYRDDAGQWQEIDLALKAVETEGGLIYRMDKAAYIVEALPDRVAWRYYSRAGGFMDMELLTVNGEPVNYEQMRHRVEGNILFWDNVAPGVDLKLCLYRKKVEDFKRFEKPTKLTWRAYRSPDFAGEFQERLAGWEPKSGDRLEILSALDGERFTEEWTGRVSRIVDRATRRKAWAADARTPVIVDASISESIVADADDGREANNTSWRFASANVLIGMNYGVVYHGGFRFQTLALPAGATISLSTLTAKILTPGGSPIAKLYGDDVADAAAWSGSNRPSGMTKTTAVLAWTPVAGGTITLGITPIVAEIAALSGWASLNNMRFAAFNQVAPGSFSYHTINVRDYAHPSDPPMQLDVTYTVAPSNNIRAAVHHQRHHNRAL